MSVYHGVSRVGNDRRIEVHRFTVGTVEIGVQSSGTIYHRIIVDRDVAAQVADAILLAAGVTPVLDSSEVEALDGWEQEANR